MTELVRLIAMQNARLLLEMPCGCRSPIYEGEIIGIPFSKLPQAVADVVGLLENNGCRCPAVQHQLA